MHYPPCPIRIILMGTDAIIDSDNDHTYTCYHTSGTAQVGLVLQGAAVPPIPCPQSPLVLFLGTQSITALFTKSPARRSSRLEPPPGAIQAAGSIHQNNGTAGNRKAGGFVNSAVTAIFASIDAPTTHYLTINSTNSSCLINRRCELVF